MQERGKIFTQASAIVCNVCTMFPNRAKSTKFACYGLVDARTWQDLHASERNRGQRLHYVPKSRQIDKIRVLWSHRCKNAARSSRKRAQSCVTSALCSQIAPNRQNSRVMVS